MKQNTNCPLCSSKSQHFNTIQERTYFKCANCSSVFLSKNDFVDKKSEKERYLTHNNDVEDEGYRNFVKPIVDAVLKDFSAHNTGLDYGAGTGPVISKMLKENGYNIKTYDPIFIPDKELLNAKYDYIVSCEVIEHFHYPDEEFKGFINALNNGGKLYIKTDLYSNEINFEKWYYKDDPTHVFFYTKNTFEWIKKTFKFNQLEIINRLIILTK